MRSIYFFKRHRAAMLAVILGVPDNLWGIADKYVGRQSAEHRRGVSAPAGAGQTEYQELSVENNDASIWWHWIWS